MKIFIVLEYKGDTSRVVDVYATELAAERRATREYKSNKAFVGTLHVIRKSVKGLHGVKFKIDGKKRYLEANVKINKSKS
jgi:hypothetical protein